MLFRSFQGVKDWLYRVPSGQGKPGKPGKGTVFRKSQGKPGKVREFLRNSSKVREKSGNFFPECLEFRGF